MKYSNSDIQPLLFGSVNKISLGIFGILMRFAVSSMAFTPPENAALTRSRLVYSQYLGPKVFLFQMDKSSLMRDYRGNSAMFDSLDSLLAIPEIYNQIDTVLITAAASPVASVMHNDSLSIQRAEAMRHYFLWKHPDLIDRQFQLSAIGIDWDGFLAQVEADTKLPNRAKILSLAKRVLNRSMSQSAALQQLRSFDRTTFNYLVKVIYPRQQYAAVRFRMKDGSYIPRDGSSPLRQLLNRENGQPVVHDTVRVTVFDTVRVVSVQEPIRDFGDIKPLKKVPVIAVGSNLLSDAVGLPDLFVEAAVSPSVSLLLRGSWMWWDTHEPNYWSYRFQGLWAEGRYWFDRHSRAGGNPLQEGRLLRPLTGWYAGAYASYFNYDFRLFKNNADDLGFLSRNSYSFGLTAGYAKRLNRSWRLDFGLGLGYATGTYYRYNYSHRSELYIQRQVKSLNYFGPTQVGVSLVWLITGKEAKNER